MEKWTLKDPILRYLGRPVLFSGDLNTGHLKYGAKEGARWYIGMPATLNPADLVNLFCAENSNSRAGLKGVSNWGH